MCINPVKLPEGEIVACRNCWQCRANRVNDLVGRCIAEQTNSAATYAVTLTYRGDGPETAMLRYRDIQLMMKLIRRRGYACRYIVAGEFGSKKGRAHWHAVLFFSCIGPTGPMPIPRVDPKLKGDKPSWDIRIGHNIHWKPWPHGFAFFQEPDYGGFAYVLKYVLKDQGEDGQVRHLAMSKKPPLGHAFFMDRAAWHVHQGLAPQDLFYSFGNVFDAKRKRRKFLLQGTSRANFLREFEHQWREVHRTEPPLSETLTAHWDKLAREEMAKTETDAHFLARKSQWPKYVLPDERSEASFWRWQMDYDNRQSLAGVIPSTLWDDLPQSVLERAANGESLVLHVWADSPDLRSTLPKGGLNIAEGGVSWRVKQDRVPLWVEWFDGLAA